MRYIILRDDDTNALTPVECLEQLYRPLLDRDLTVNLAVIPNVRTDAQRADGKPEGFLHDRGEIAGPRAWIGRNRKLTAYLQRNPGYQIVQHGYDHSLYEFASHDEIDIARRLDKGARLLAEAGLAGAQTFVAPHDRFSPESLRAVARRFAVISAGWFEWSTLPPAWWPAYVVKKMRGQPHWRANRTLLLSHPGCLLSRFRPRENLFEEIKRSIASRQLTVLVTHWWEYFPEGRPDTEFIGFLHRTADYLASEPDLRVISFGDLARNQVPLH